MGDALIGQWQARIRAAVAARASLRLRGGGTKDFYGQALQGDVLDTGGYAGIVDYDPTELVLTARAGTPLADIEAAMRAAGQMLAFEPPHFGERAASEERGELRVRMLGRRGDTLRERMGRQAAAAVGHVLSRRQARDSTLGRCACRRSRATQARRRRPRRWRRILAQRARADASVLRICACGHDAVVAPLRQADGAVRRSRRGSAGRVGRRVTLAS